MSSAAAAAGDRGRQWGEDIKVELGDSAAAANLEHLDQGGPAIAVAGLRTRAHY